MKILKFVLWIVKYIVIKIFSLGVIETCIFFLPLLDLLDSLIYCIVIPAVGIQCKLVLPRTVSTRIINPGSFCVWFHRRGCWSFSQSFRGRIVCIFSSIISSCWYWCGNSTPVVGSLWNHNDIQLNSNSSFVNFIFFPWAVEQWFVAM